MNFVYANPRSAVSKKGKAVSLKRQGLMTIVMLPAIIVVSALMSWYYYGMMKQMPEMYYIQFFSLTLVSIGLTFFYSFSTFFQTRDFEQYQYYPYTKGEVFLAKLVTNLLMFSPGLILVGALSLSFGLGQGGILTGMIQMFAGIIFVLLLFVLGMGVVFYVGTQKYLQKYSTYFLGIGLCTLVLGAMIFGGSVGGISGASIGSNGEIVSVNIIGEEYLHQYTKMLKEAPWIAALLSLLLLLLMSSLAFYFYKVSAKRYITLGVQEQRVTKAKTSYAPNSLKKAMFKHNWNIVSVNKQYISLTLATQFLPMLILLPVLFLDTEVSELLRKPEMSAMFLLAGGLLVFLTNMFVISEHLYSLERENLDYMIALPLSRTFIYREKKRFGLMISTIPLLLYAIVIQSVLKLNPLNIVCFLGGTLMVNYLYQTYYLIQDYKMPNINWSSEMDLLQGGMRTFVRLLRFYGLIFISVMLIVTFVFTVAYWIAQILVLLMLCGVAYYFIQQAETKCNK